MPIRVPIAIRITHNVIAALRLLHALIDGAGIQVGACDGFPCHATDRWIATLRTVAIPTILTTQMIGFVATALDRKITGIKGAGNEIIALLVVETRGSHGWGRVALWRVDRVAVRIHGF